MRPTKASPVSEGHNACRKTARESQRSESSTEGRLREPRSPKEPEVMRVRSDDEASS